MSIKRSGFLLLNFFPLCHSLQIVEGTARPLIHTFDVKKRSYYGNTSMESEISLLMANQTLVSRSLHRFLIPLSDYL